MRRMTILVVLLLTACDTGSDGPEPEPISEEGSSGDADQPDPKLAGESGEEVDPAANVPFNGERMPISEGLTYTSGGDCDCGDTDTDGSESSGCAESTGDDDFAQ